MFLLANSITDFLSNQLVIVGIVLAAIGFAFALLAKRIAKAVRQTSEVAPNDNVMITFKAFGLVCIVVALVLMIVAVN